MRLLITSFALIGALAFAGCGDDQTAPPRATSQAAQTAATPEGTTPAANTHDDFMVALDRLCKRGAEEARKASARGDEAGDDPDVVATLLDERAVERTRLTADLAELGAPPEDAANFARYLKLTRQMDGLMPRTADAVRERDVDDMTRLSELMESVENERTTVAIDLGSNECG